MNFLSVLGVLVLKGIAATVFYAVAGMVIGFGIGLASFITYASFISGWEFLQ